eukprot:8578489-Lingulodinium_polyedra.AAC.1
MAGRWSGDGRATLAVKTRHYVLCRKYRANLFLSKKPKARLRPKRRRIISISLLNMLSNNID